ncbi:hypothetical protein KV697_13820 [Sphingomonas sanguinis]|uniref:hypothetical protein n=1 Tax=Sphingomonas sanguinis TaxID=33051 RepID=UPI001C590431|nr:hypothetical protein [Sphingomonas sanguinis]QXT34853.1 hypothetical protein KV697_13820 [Sphingomonas sanguinis]
MSGHQERDGADWQWTGEALEGLLVGLPCPIEGWSSLAIGADQLFAETVLRMGGSLTTVVPGEWYEECYGTPQALARYRDLLGRGDVVALGGFEGEEAFLQAGRRIVEETDLLVAIWDGRPARGRGGTGDIVEYALGLGKPVRRIDPVRREHHDLGKG